MTKTFRGIIEKDSKGYHAYVPALKGCHTWGKTIAQAKKHLQEATELYVESMIAHGVKVPDDVANYEFSVTATKATVQQRQYA